MSKLVDKECPFCGKKPIRATLSSDGNVIYYNCLNPYCKELISDKDFPKEKVGVKVSFQGTKPNEIVGTDIKLDPNWNGSQTGLKVDMSEIKQPSEKKQESEKLNSITKVYEVLKECYTFVDYRCAYFKEDDKWISIVSAFRFTNKEYDEINDYHERLRKLTHNTEWFKIEFEILNIKEWRAKWEETKKGVDFLEDNFDLNSLNLFLNMEYNSHSPITEVDRKFNTIQFNVSSYEYKEHHKRLEYLKEKIELRSIGITSIYPTIKQTLQINFNNNSQIFSVFLFPIYFKITNVSYTDNNLLGDIEYHKIFHKSNLIIKHYLRGNEQGIIENFLIENEIKPNRDYYRTRFEIIIDEDLHQIEENISEFVLNLYFSPFDLELTDFRYYASKVVLTDTEYEFDFALSFAGEDRDLVETIANSLRDKELNIFYDEYYKADLIGKDLSDYFKKIYGNKSRYVVVFISKHYPVKNWTNFEFETAKEEAKIRKQEFILPIRLDDTIIHGLKSTIGYIDYLKQGLQRTVDILYEKVKKIKKYEIKPIKRAKQLINTGFPEMDIEKIEFQTEVQMPKVEPPAPTEEKVEETKEPPTPLRARLDQDKPKNDIQIGVVCSACQKPSMILNFERDQYKCLNCLNNTFFIAYRCETCDIINAISKRAFINGNEPFQINCPDCNRKMELVRK